MSEMATARFGQIAISINLVFHIYLFRYGDYPDYTALIIKTRYVKKPFTQVASLSWR